jgi:hypothetical protein
MTMSVDPLTRWRLNIKGMGGDSTGAIPSEGAHYLTFNAATDLWTRTSEGIIAYDYDIANLGGAGTGGPYRVNPVVVPFGDDHDTGGSFWELKEGPHPGYLVSFWSNSLGYGDITVTSDTAFNRGPGETLFTLEYPAAHLCGASMNYNAAGEMHFTMLVDDPNIALVQPKLTHYSIDFYINGDWVEAFAGLIWDMDATDTEVVFEGIDYLGLLNYILDERFDPKAPDKAAPDGSKYVDKSIHDIVDALLDYAIALPDSPVNFISVGDIAAMDEKVTIFSTMSRILPFITDMLNSHRAGTGKYTRIYVKKTGTNQYQFTVDDDPGVQQTGLPVAYGDLANGYRIIKFGKNWASRVSVLGRSRDGLQVSYEHNDSGVDQSVWGRISQDAQMIEPKAGFLGPKVKSDDTNDLKRRARQAALDASRLGQSVGIGFKLGSFAPEDGWALLDSLPIVIEHGGARTTQWASDVFGQDTAADPSVVKASFWTIVGYQWESYDDGHWMNTLLLFPSGGGDLPQVTVTPTLKNFGETGWQPSYYPNPHSVSLAGFTAAAGDTMYAVLFQRGSGATIGAGSVSGFTQIGTTVKGYDGTQSPLSDATAVSLWYKVAAGGETSIVVNADSPGDQVSLLWEIHSGIPAAAVPVFHSATGTMAADGSMHDLITVAGSGTGYIFGGWAMQQPAGYGTGVRSAFDHDAYQPPLYDDQEPRHLKYALTNDTLPRTIQGQMWDSGGVSADKWGWAMAVATVGSVGPPYPITSSPVVPRTPITTGDGAPASDNPQNVSTYVDRVTGDTYTWNDNTDSWDAPVAGTIDIKDWPLSDVLAKGNLVGGNLIESAADGTSGGGTLELDDASGSSAGSAFLLAGGTPDGLGGAFGAFGADSGTGGRATMQGGNASSGGGMGASVQTDPGASGGVHGKVAITSDNDSGSAAEVLTANGSGYATWQAVANGMLKWGTADPSAGAGVASAIGSLYMRDNSGAGELWVKTAASNTSWTKVTLP